ncbi:MOSC domain-containing protein [Alkalimarinus alittae]|uniref:MOSC domain-containing protein n=1 Tax=Alkalimarinus alittae TaxID=2961619 RepID=A0ABY6N6L0_9ALTE|nr:MOSC N-terminal beta barrel domain-containing protein [Alkalimarinus alittae]UZE97726.1 MOSC domain-containing protein [Alkalimarinus alittae]
MQLASINKYPVKSLKGVPLASTIVDDFGIQNDRRWMLIDDKGVFITQRKYPLLGTISVEDQGVALRFCASGGAELKVSAARFSEHVDTVVWGDAVGALKAEPSVSDWFSSLLGVRVNLVYMPNSSFRQVDRQYADYKQRVSFADGYPFLLTTEASLLELNERLDSPVMMSRFRPNLVVSGCDAYEEDRWKRIRVGEIEFEIVKPCSRCIMTTIDESTLKYGKEPLKTLAGYRRNEYGVCFGQNLVHKNLGTLDVGAKVEILEWL